MEEKDLLKTILNNSVIAIPISIIFVALAYVVVVYGYGFIQLLLCLVSPLSLITMSLTYVAFVVMFKPKDVTDIVIKWGDLAVIYSTVLGLCGESIYIALLIFGLFIVVGFLISEVSITAILTHKDLKEWEQIEQQNERRAREKQEKVDQA